MQEVQILKIADIVQMLSISKPTIWRYVKNGTLPRPIYIQNRIFGWRKSTILEWLDSLEEAA
ncbi:helix-turn-helix transcriptional regulator [Pseudoalteromonas spongiae]|uniref:AlpA family phage regulatory protein n=1 Tax=Pseudoalteromonas spongiae TaxID=298657 RepID=A0ABU8ETN3_9GAMM